MRHRPHSYLLPQCNSNLYKKSFVIIIVCLKTCNHYFAICTDACTFDLCILINWLIDWNWLIALSSGFKFCYVVQTKTRVRQRGRAASGRTGCADRRRRSSGSVTRPSGPCRRPRRSSTTSPKAAGVFSFSCGTKWRGRSTPPTVRPRRASSANSNHDTNFREKLNALNEKRIVRPFPYIARTAEHGYISQCIYSISSNIRCVRAWLRLPWFVDDAKCILVTRVCVCLYVCPRSHAHCTDPDVTWGMVEVPLVVHYWADLQSVRGLRRCGNIARTRNVSECLYSLYAWLSLRRSHTKFSQPFDLHIFITSSLFNDLTSSQHSLLISCYCFSTTLHHLC